MAIRKIVFVSHANPEDNAFARWLSLKLAALGYQVWSDVTRLLGGEDFWADIEPVIRDSCAKFVFVLSRASNHREGVLRELRVADQTRKKDGLKDFIVPIRIDDVPHDDINIELARLNAIDGRDWASGLKALLKKLAEDAVPCDGLNGPETVRRWWAREFASDLGVTSEPEVHYSNWFRIVLPGSIYQHRVVGLLNGEPTWAFPTRWHDRRLITFASRSDVASGFGALSAFQSDKSSTSGFLSSTRHDRTDNRNIVLGLLSDGWDRLAQARGLKKHEMAGNRSAYYFDLDSLPNSNVGFQGVDGDRTHRGLMGYKTRKSSGTRRHWHFAISARPVIHPEPILQLRTHVLFSEDGRTIWSSDEAMHRARRSQCKGWWNDDWRDRLLAAMTWLANGQSRIRLPLSHSSGVAVIDSRPVEFLSPVTLLEPGASPDLADAPDGEEDEEDEDLATESAGVGHE